MNYQAAVNISANFTGQSAVDQAKRGFDGLNGSIKNLYGGLKTLAAAYAIKEAVSYAKSIIDLGDSMNDLRQKTGIGVNSLSDLKAAAEDNGLQFDAMESSLKKFTVTFAKAQAGVKDAQAGFQALGFTQEQITSFKSADEALLAVADKFKGAKDGAEKLAVAVALAGKSGGDMVPLLNQGREGIKGMGIQMSDEFVRQSDLFNDQLNKSGRNAKQMGVDILEGILPSLNKLIEKTNELSASFREAFSEKGIKESEARIAETTAGIGGALDRLKNNKVDLLKLSILDTIGAFKKLFTLNPFGSSEKPAQSAGLADSLKSRSGETGTGVPTVKIDSSFLNTEDKKKLEDQIKQIQKRIEALKAETLEVGKSNAARAYSVEIAKIDTSVLKPNTDEYVRLTGALKETVYQKERAKELDAASDYSKTQKEENDLRRIEIEQVNYSTVAYKELVLQKQMEAEIRKKTKDLTAEGTKAMEQEIRAAYAAKKANAELEEQNKRTFGNGAKQAFKEYVENAQNASRQAYELFSGALRGLEDALVSFIKTGKLSFKDLADFIETELIRIAVRRTIAFGLASAGLGGGGAAFANGGIMTDHGPVALRTYAGGGIANSPQLALFGEGSKPEAYVPLPDGRSIPVTMKGSGGGNNVIVNVNMYGEQNQQTSETSSGENARQLGRVISATVVSEIIKQKRPGGLLA